MPSRQPLPGVLPAVERGDLLRVTTYVRIEDVEHVPGEAWPGSVKTTILERALSAPQLVDGVWMVECMNIGMVPACAVEVQP